MSETKRHYCTDSYLTRFESQVIASTDDGLRISLAETCFYPTSGGQPHDVGTLNDVAVVDVVEEGGMITHIMASALEAKSVQGEILWPRRYDHMQQHTGQHLLSAVFEELFQIPTLSFRMGDDASTIELGTKELSLAQVEAATLRATELARNNSGIAVSFEDALKAQGLRKPSERAGILRIVEIPDIDRSACGGTHVATLAEVLPLQIRDMDKVRGNVRISFVCGNRAMRRAQTDFKMLSHVAVALGVPQDQVEVQVAVLKQALAESEKQRQRMETEAATGDALDLYSTAVPGADGVRRAILQVPVIDESARTKAKAFTSQPQAVILVYSTEGVLLGCSADSGVNAGAVLKHVLSTYGARGGGSATMAQGSVSDPAMVHDLAEQLQLRGAK
jgi:alanyl-tRNA synthetase